ncbi:MAG: glycosyltransferase family 4 protein [Bacteroidota bacterium]
MDNSLRILQLIDDATVGGGQQHVLLLSRGLKARGFNVTVACAANGYLVHELHKLSIPVVPIALSNRISFGQLFRLKILCKELRVDVLHSHGGTAGLWGRLAGMWSKVPVRIHTHHGLHALHWNRSLSAIAAQGVERLLKRSVSSVICVSEGEARLGILRKVIDPRNCVVIRNGIDLQDYEHLSDPQSLRKEFRLLPDHIVIGTVGRFHVQKGYEYLIRAIPIVLEQHPNARFLLAGEGELLESVRSMIASSGLAEKVILTGARYDIPNFLGSMDIFVLPSLWEGYPLSLLEASAAGKAIVATDVEGNNEIVRQRVNGLLVPPRDPDALACAIGELISDVALRNRLGASAREIARSSYSSELMIDSIATLYRKSYEANQNV